ncbi:phytoene/squalene synthase family protein [Wenzhouxiangella sp. EGI_FJ10409]|uniref:phytoene/squalene synthase family protein n=1 Tax=Wenzhouxiangella sp. EGI_FJ10409 TaxID=3243767 RepID=UPI0035D96393
MSTLTPTRPDLPVDRAVAVLRHHGRSFYFAGQLLGGRDFERSARLYAFCRWLDDLVDEGHPALARRYLDRVRRDLALRRPSSRNVADFLALSEDCDIPLSAALDLLDGLEQDLGHVRLEDWDELVRYAYRVAGTVGLMMSQVLGARETAARPFAIDLGIAMQLTNIARDVREDAEADRRYLPASWVGEIEPVDLRRCPKRVGAACRKMLGRAETYYDSGLSGLSYLPLRPALAIGVAGRVYRQIGRRMLARGANPLAGRTIVPTWQKCLLTPPSVIRQLMRDDPGDHDLRLHEPLAGLDSQAPPVVATSSRHE